MELTQRDTVPAAFSKDTGWKELIPQAEETEAASGPGQKLKLCLDLSGKPKHRKRRMQKKWGQQKLILRK